MNKAEITQHEFYMISAHELIELEVWHAFDRVTQGHADIEFALSHWTQVWGFVPWHISKEPDNTPRNEKQLYIDTLSKFSRIREKHADSRDCTAFSRDAMKFLEPLIDETGREWMRNPPKSIKWSGCFGFNMSNTENRAMLHFYNACCPRSPFDNIDELRDDLRQCLIDIRSSNPGTTAICGASWINNLEPFISLFPENYVASLVETEPDGKSGSGWWGQFLTKTGHLNENRAQELKQTGEFRYKRKTGKCGLPEALHFLNNNFQTTFS